MGSELRMVTTAGKVIITIGVMVIFFALFAPLYMSYEVGLFLILAGILTIVQGARMKPIETRAPSKDTTGAHYKTGNTIIKKDPNSKGVM